MSSNVISLGWQRLLAWMYRPWRKSGKPGGAAAPNARDARHLRTSTAVAAWEDEGGATAGCTAADGNAVPAEPVKTAH